MNPLVVAARKFESLTGTGTSLAGEGNTVQEALRRLRMISLAMSILPLWVLIGTRLFAAPGSAQREALPTLAVAQCSGMAISLGVYFALKSEKISPARRLDIGFAYQALLAFMIAMFRHVTPWIAGDGFREISPVAVVILVFAALIPNKPRRTFVASLVSAAMDPLALWISIARGNPAPPMGQIVAIVATPFSAALMATVISKVVYRLAKSADDARRMGSYELIEKLGSGGMGEVWRATHRFLARPAAIKLIRAEVVGDLGALRRFEREALATSALKEPHTIQLYDFGVSEDGTFYYVMELLEGFDLYELVQKHGPVPAERAIHILRQACASLEEAHERGLVHRDIKPANIFVCRYGRHADFVKVLDFGLVKPNALSTPSELAPTVTIDGALSGTPAFIAPEMALGEKEVDGRADLYALGCVGYWLLTGKLVFEAETSMKMILEHVRGVPPPISGRTEIAVPEALERVILDCLEKDPAKRPRTAGVLSDRLAAIELERPWSRERARGWWDVHAPEGGKPPSIAPSDGPAPEPTEAVSPL